MNAEVVSVVTFPNVSTSSSGNLNIYTVPFPGLYRVSVYAEQISGTFVLDVELVWENIIPAIQSFDMGSLDTSTSTITFRSALVKSPTNTFINYTFTSGSGVCNIYATVEKIS